MPDLSSAQTKYLSRLKREKYFSSAVTPSGKKLCSRRQENDSKTFWEAKKTLRPM